MATTRTTNSFSATVPQLTDTANVETAFNAYHDSIASTTTGVAVLNRANTFTANIAINNGTSTALTTTGTTAALFNTGATTLNVGGAATTLSLGAATGTTTVNNTLTLAAGTTSKAPLDFTSGTNTTNPVAGAFEYDGNLFYATPKVNNTTAGRGLLPAQNIFRLFSNNTQSVSSAGATITTDFYAFGKSIYLAASQAYYVDMCIRVYHNLTYTGSGSGSITFLLKAPTNSSFEIDTQNQIDMATLATAGTPTFEFLSGLGVSKAIKTGLGSSDTGYSIFK